MYLEQEEKNSSSVLPEVSVGRRIFQNRSTEHWTAPAG